MLKAALAAAVVVGTAGAAKADLTLNGNTGMFLNPNAYLVSKDKPQVQVNYFKLYSEPGYSVNTYNITGVLRAGDRAEVGAGVSKLDADDYYYNDTDFIVNAKYQLRAPENGNFALAAGAGYNGALADNKYAYLVASKPFGKIIDRGPISASVGVRWDSFSWGGYDHSSKVSVFGGVEVPIGDKLAVIGELQSKNLEFEDSKSPYSIGLRYHANNKFTLGAGLAQSGIMNESSKLFVQVGYNFGS